VAIRGRSQAVLEKQALREEVWARMTAEGVARFPGAVGRIPNFPGAERAAERLNELSEWTEARVVKVNPDAPQRPVRRLALEQGKTVLMAVPRLTKREGFILLDPKELTVSPHEASSIRGAFRYGRPVAPEDLPNVDLMIMGSVAVGEGGERVGKGGGYADLEYGLLRQFGKIGPETAVLTTVHPIQVLDSDIPMTKHDVPLKWIVTAEGIRRCRGVRKPPEGIYWDDLTGEKIASIPILRELAGQRKVHPA